ncbi:hypothetical protein IFM89_011055 [Coptis chinensis]|uniref:F-box domain-containing protein n=1 Tax=Coptis chinensis TaxID=261450 RepID=A0A835M5T8_9MAGN|nr:hypothetical protein IFM89_011055 [Coptis chinensis]
MQKSKMKKSKMDMISALPDSIIDHIFSFMDMKKVIQTSLLSKRWRNLWKSTSTLNFHILHSTPYRKRIRTAFTNFVYRVLLLRDDSKIQKFNLLCPEKQLEDCHVFSWIIAAIGRNVQEFALHLYVYSDGISYTESLYHLFMADVKKLHLIVSQLPTSFCSASKIKSLIVEGAKLPDGDCNRELTLSCSVLETLLLTDCRINHLKVFTISTPVLKTLALYNSGGYCYCSCKVNICCPNLRSLNLSSREVKDYSLENLFTLDTVDFDVQSIRGDEGLDVVNVRRLTNVLRGICNIRALTLRDPFLKILTDCADLLDRVPGLFHKLRFLKVKEWSATGTCFRALAIFIERSACIETLVLARSKERSSSESQEGCSEDSLFQSKFYCLGTITIRDPRLDKDELKFIKVLLNRAVVLKELVIKTTKTNSSYIKKLATFRNKLLAVPRASSSVSVTFFILLRPAGINVWVALLSYTRSYDSAANLVAFLRSDDAVM